MMVMITVGNLTMAWKVRAMAYDNTAKLPIYSGYMLINKEHVRQLYFSFPCSVFIYIYNSFFHLLSF